MRFSTRTNWPAETNAISQAVAARRAAGLPLIDLTETNPTRVGLSPAVDLTASREYDPDPVGMRSAREAVAKYHGNRVPPEHIVLAASTSEAYSWIFKVLCEPEDSIAIPAPSYPLFSFLARVESVRLVPYATRSWDDWSIDLDSLRREMDSRTRAVIVVSPNNPTGAILHSSDRQPLVKLCAERGAAVIADEVFADYAEPRADRVASLAGEAGALTFVLSGLSKVCLTPQLKVGWMAVSGPDAERDEALRRIDLIADTFLSVNSPAQLALPDLLARRAEIQAPLKKRIAANRRALATSLHESAATLLPADGGWSALIRLPASHGEEGTVLDLIQRGVLVHPGYFFDFAEERYLVVSLIPSESDFAAATAEFRQL